MISTSSIFNEAFDSKLLTESIMDYPNGDGLNEKVWRKDGDVWKMHDSVSKKILGISKELATALKLKGVVTVVVGSICTNSYDEDSDIDVHLEVNGLKGRGEEYMRKLNRKARDLFGEKFGDVKFGGHKVEVYVQNNKFQDMGSRGAYNVETGEWISGPQISDDDFDPYDEYFMKSMDSIEKDGCVESAGDVILRALILMNAILLMRGQKTIKKSFKMLNEVSKEAKAVFDKMRLSRKASSTPRSKKASERMRDDEKWNVKDASFKLLSDFGLMAALKDLANLNDVEGDEKFKAKTALCSLKKSLFQD